MVASADIVIIGVGIAGVSLAARLSKLRSVILIEMESHPGYHATGRSAAYYAPAYGNDVVREITVASGQFLRHPPSGFSEVPLVNTRPTMFIATEMQAESVATMLAENPSLEPLTENEIKQAVPIIDKGLITRGVMDRTGGDIDVDALMQGFLRQFRQNDGELITGEQVSGLSFKKSNWQITTTNYAYAAPIVVNAAGAWADDVAQRAGLGKLGLEPKRRTVVLVDKPVDTDISDWPLVVDVDERFYFKPDAGQLLISPADETLMSPCDAQPDDYDIAVGIDRVQQVASLDVRRVNHSWAGLRTFAEDQTFVSGFDARAKGFYWLAGQGGYGVQSCTAMADIATFNLTGECDLMSARMIDALAARLSPQRPALSAKRS